MVVAWIDKEGNKQKEDILIEMNWMKPRQNDRQNMLKID